MDLQSAVEFVSGLLTKSNITFALSLFGSAGTFYVFVKSRIEAQKNIDIAVVDYSNQDEIHQFMMRINNQSSKPICISVVSFFYENKKYDCELIHKKILHHAPELPWILNPYFPLNIPSLTGRTYFLEFLDCPDMQVNPGKTVCFQFQTNRGVINKTVILGERSHYLNNV